MTDEHAGWAIVKTTGDYAVAHTTNAGRDWKVVSPPGFSPAAHGADVFADEQGIDLATFGLKDAWVARVYGPQNSLQLFIWHTIDSGQHWSVSKIPVSDTYGLYLDFVDTRHGFLLATSDAAMGQTGKRFYRTSDGGQTWRLVADGFPGHPTKGALPRLGFPNGISFRDSQNGWVGMSPRGDTDVTLYRTKDGGATWQLQSAPVPTKFHSGEYDSDTRSPYFFHGGQNGVLAMQLIRDNWTGLAVSTTNNGGATWQRAKIISGGSYTSTSAESGFCFTSDGHGWVPEDNGAKLYSTQNLGHTWKSIRPNQTLGSPTSEIQLDFVNDRMGWALSTQVDPVTSAESSNLLETRDGGYHWQMIYSSGAPGSPKKARK